MTAATDGNGTISYAVKSGDAVRVDASTGALTVLKAGTAVITATAAVTDDYLEDSADIVVTVQKAEPVVTGVSARELTYSGSPQALVNAGATDGGTLQYAIGKDAATAPTDSDYSASVPKGTEAGSYYTWYRVVGDANYNDCGPYPVTVTILNAKVEPRNPTGESLIYNGKDQRC